MHELGTERSVKRILQMVEEMMKRQKREGGDIRDIRGKVSTGMLNSHATMPRMSMFMVQSQNCSVLLHSYHTLALPHSAAVQHCAV